MYKAPGTPFSIYGTDRAVALKELLKQLNNINAIHQKFTSSYPELADGKLNFSPHTILGILYIQIYAHYIIRTLSLRQRYFTMRCNAFSYHGFL